MKRTINHALVFAVAAASTFCSPAMAQNFPVKPLRIVVGLAPGGGTDIIARMVGQRLSTATGQQIIIDNRAGASGNIAAEIVAKSPADGYTLIDTIAGQVDAFLPTIISGLPQARSGKVRAIGVTTLKRAAVLPEVPTVAEQGFPGYEVSGWYGLLAPAGTPNDVIATLNREVVKVLHSPEARERLAAEGAEGVGNTPEQFGAYMRSEMVKWSKVVKQSGARAD